MPNQPTNFKPASRRNRHFHARAVAVLPLVFGIQLAIAQALPEQNPLCPTNQQPWNCERVDGLWRCQGSVQSLTQLVVDQDVSGASDVLARTVTSEDGNVFRLEGDVSVVNGAQQLKAPQVVLDRGAQTAQALGPVQLSDAGVLMYADRVNANLADKTTVLTDIRYALRNTQGNGRARSATHAENSTTLKGVTFTSCPGDQPVWQVKASTIKLDHAEKIGQARDFKLMLGNMPVFYLPFASFPLTNERKSGLLAPVIAGSDDGLDLTLPYYFNLAPNYDLTLNNRIIQQRGFMLGSEFRYLGVNSNAFLRGTYLSNDRKTAGERYSANIDWRLGLGANWNFISSLNAVSDDFYFEDLGDSLTVASTSVLPSSLGFYGRGSFTTMAGLPSGIWQAGLSTDRFEIIDPANPNTPDPYRRTPRLFYAADQRAGDFQFGVKTELVSFQREDLIGAFSPEGERFDIAPFVRYEWRTPYAYVRPELTFRHTRYSLNSNPSTTANANTDFRRSLPIASLDTGLIFERFAPFGQENWRQTLEPRLFLLSAPFRDQSEFPVFDTSELDFSFPQLFRNNRFSGADRQADAEQATLAISTRILDDDQSQERLRLSLGQIRYFEPSRVTLPGTAPFLGSQGVWVGEVASEIGRSWRVAASQQYDPEISRTRLSAIRIQRKLGDQGLVNLGYRYRPDQIEQVDLSGLIPINERWSAIGRWNYSLPESRTLEGLAGFEYRSCCWRLRVLGRHYLRAGTLSGRNSIFFELELNGLGSLGRKTDRLLERAIVGFSDTHLD
jgi:LPS-assembly protein